MPGWGTGRLIQNSGILRYEWLRVTSLHVMFDLVMVIMHFRFFMNNWIESKKILFSRQL